MKSPKLKSSIILKKVNDNCVFAIDCESEEDSFFKFEGASKFFLESIHQGEAPEDIIKKALTQFQGVTQAQIENDLNDFFQTIEEFEIIQR